MNAPNRSAIRACLVDALGGNYERAHIQNHGAGCINDTYQVVGEGLETLFVKAGPSSAKFMFEKEALGLNLLRTCDQIRVPKVVALNDSDACAVLVLEFVQMQSVGRCFGSVLAMLHSIQLSQYGLDHNNFIGRTPQINTWKADWWQFFAENRLKPQRRLAQMNGMRPGLLAQLDALIEQVVDMTGQYHPPASLLHGDLWSGNIAADKSGTPVLYDPAVYYGDSETDLAMSRMFGAMSDHIYKDYHSIIPLRPGAFWRQRVYDLYHWLNHFNLFGVTYLGQVIQLVDWLLGADRTV